MLRRYASGMSHAFSSQLTEDAMINSSKQGVNGYVGSSVTAFIGGFRDDARQIDLWQNKPEWMSSRPTQNEWRH